MKFANIMRSAAAATARPTTLMLQLLNTNQLRGFAASRLRVQKTLSMSTSREDAKTRRIRMNFANIMRSAAAATARPTRLMLQLYNTNPLRGFAASRAKSTLNVHQPR